MTEPVAWRYKNVNQKVWCVSQIKPDERAWGIIEPLYAADQLHQRVKMTQKQLNAFTKWNKRNKLLSPVELIWDVMGANEYPDEFDLELQEVSRDDKYLLSLANIWEIFDADNPEKTIEIVPDMKWFVRSKEKENGRYQVLAESRVSDMPRYTIFKSCAMTFDTKEEAEKWTNPLTEAVQLPVEVD